VPSVQRLAVLDEPVNIVRVAYDQSGVEVRRRVRGRKNHHGGAVSRYEEAFVVGDDVVEHADEEPLAPTRGLMPLCFDEPKEMLLQDLPVRRADQNPVMDEIRLAVQRVLDLQKVR